MDILDGPETNRQGSFRDQQLGRKRPQLVLVNTDPAENWFLQPHADAVSVDSSTKALLNFWSTHVVGSRMPLIREMDTPIARAGDSQQAAAFILAEPRCVLRNGIPLPSDEHLFDEFFDEKVQPKSEGASVIAAYPYHCRLLSLAFVDVKLVLERTARSLNNEGVVPQRDPELHGIRGSTALDAGSHPGSVQKEVAREQQQRIEALVHAHLVDSNLYTSYGPLAMHPSILFLFGWLCFKSGTGAHLLRSITLLTEAGKRGLLRATCGLLRALARFFIIWEAQDSVVREYVIADLIESLKVAYRSEENEVAEAPLLIEAHSALAILHMGSKEDIPDNFKGALREIQQLKARRHCTDAHRLFHMWRGTKLPSRLFLRASRLCDMDPPGCVDWKHSQHVLSGIELRWRRKFGKVPEGIGERIARVQMGKGNDKTQLAGYESGAVVLPPPDPAVVAKVGAEASQWKISKQPLELRRQPPRFSCQVCGQKAPQITCHRCKTVMYCSNGCLHFDRLCGAHSSICVGNGN